MYICNPILRGSSLNYLKKAALAQLVEQLICNQ